MKQSFKPDGYTSVAPYIVADGAQRVIDFMATVFDARQARRYDLEDGSILHAEVQIDDSIVMIGDGNDAYPPSPSLIHVYVPDVDAAFRRALEHGGTAVEKPDQREGDPDRRGAVKDPAGNIWSIATQLG